MYLCQTFPMRNLTTTICLTIAVLLGSGGVSWSADFQKGLSYVRKLVTELSGGVFGYLDSVLERHSFDEFGELI